MEAHIYEGFNRRLHQKNFQRDYELPITGAANDARLGKAENIISVGVSNLFPKRWFNLIFTVNNAGDKVESASFN